MDRLSEFRFDFNKIETESISFEIINKFDYCPALNKAIKYVMRSVKKYYKTKKNVDRVTA